MIETKRERFIRLAENRTNKALDMIRLIGNLANKNVYEFDVKDVNKIFESLEEEIQMAKNAFINTDRSDNKFKLI